MNTLVPTIIILLALTGVAQVTLHAFLLHRLGAQDATERLCTFGGMAAGVVTTLLALWMLL